MSIITETKKIIFLIFQSINFRFPIPEDNIFLHNAYIWISI